MNTKFGKKQTAAGVAFVLKCGTSQSTRLQDVKRNTTQYTHTHSHFVFLPQYDMPRHLGRAGARHAPHSGPNGGFKFVRPHVGPSASPGAAVGSTLPDYAEQSLHFLRVTHNNVQSGPSGADPEIRRCPHTPTPTPQRDTAPTLARYAMISGSRAPVSSEGGTHTHTYTFTHTVSHFRFCEDHPWPVALGLLARSVPSPAYPNQWLHNRPDCL